MFFFGDDESAAQLARESALASDGPAVSSSPMQDMTVEELMVAMTYARMACQSAINEGLPQGVFEILLAEYDQMFETLAKKSPAFVEVVRMNRHVYLGGYSDENVAKYRALAGV